MSRKNGAPVAGANNSATCVSSAQEMSQVRQSLLNRHADVSRELSGNLSLLQKPGTNLSGDMADAALDSAQDDVNSQLVEVESRNLRQIQAALGHAKAGTYGKCEGCGGKIPKARLSALPHTTLCIKCAREMERRGAANPSEVDWSRLQGDPEDLSDELDELDRLTVSQ